MTTDSGRERCAIKREKKIKGKNKEQKDGGNMYSVYIETHLVKSKGTRPTVRAKIAHKANRKNAHSSYSYPKIDNELFSKISFDIAPGVVSNLSGSKHGINLIYT